MSAQRDRDRDLGRERVRREVGRLGDESPTKQDEIRRSNKKKNVVYSSTYNFSSAPFFTFSDFFSSSFWILK